MAAPPILEPWLELLRPVRRPLTDPLCPRSSARIAPDTITRRAATMPGEYASEEPDLLADLLMDADPNLTRRLFQVVEKQADKVVPILRAAN